ncbi:hypothetical protein PoB_002694000 [Plakobranchus ocellatus]|uniref:Uncharacterized protein n=1 Tax=Plakobranchus ocellatus TaxID=259542 RepID=A0AAV4A0J3_9GAST|nr:hypothetical protein PoB_002694000 [Plakobranchus ocellatus]
MNLKYYQKGKRFAVYQAKDKEEKAVENHICHVSINTLYIVVEQASRVSVGPDWRQQFTCPTIHVLKYSLSLVGAHTKSATCRSVGAVLCGLQPALTSVVLLDKVKEGCHYVTTHNSTDRFRAKHEASLVTQIIKLTCRNWQRLGFGSQCLDPPGQGPGDGARTRDRRVSADLRADSLSTTPRTLPSIALLPRNVTTGHHLVSGFWTTKTLLHFSD